MNSQVKGASIAILTPIICGVVLPFIEGEFVKNFVLIVMYLGVLIGNILIHKETIKKLREKKKLKIFDKIDYELIDMGFNFREHKTYLVEDNIRSILIHSRKLDIDEKIKVLLKTKEVLTYFKYTDMNELDLTLKKCQIELKLRELKKDF